ncbi:NLR family CARD domain-containing protein 4 [Varanus komodoensis]|uniref:NLR family CARD domain-containing protein 4 n=1 Tax=Varanus komodoensis TaxID=61221 RepID=A0A8D2KWH5_VARKO|nr:NLR family CARD domain-containing protein 4 [Varanus komodoensis]XP_044309606.1 NLR family CARD domain-containing protein 4 [Varanus komodoensis]XP_044309693.1 NLR family CARD domain-containing protein 4 [Varanus komodoensis]
MSGLAPGVTNSFSSVDFIQKNSVQLIQKMLMPTIEQIIDEFFAQSVLSDEEQDIIMCQKTRRDAARALIRLILKKGEKACEFFIKALEKIDFLLFQNLLGYRGAGQMTQEDFNCLVEDLTDFYSLPSFQQFHPLGGEIDIIFNLTKTYTDILLWKKDIHNVQLGQLSLNALLDELKNPCIIEGEAGKGKTTLLKKIALLWANGDYPSLLKYKLVFFIRLSDAQTGLYETVCEQLLKKEYRICKEDFMELLDSLREKVLFLLDGYDEFQSQNCPEIESLIKENHKFKNTVIVTTRTESISSLRLFGSLIAKTGDLTKESAKQLIRNVLRTELAEGLLSQLERTDSTFQRSGSHFDNLMKTPLFVVIACAIQMGETMFNPQTQTTLFSTLYDLLVGKNKYKTREIPDKHFRLSLIHCGDLALNGVFDNKVNFYPEDFSSVKEQVLLTTGLMHKYAAQKLTAVYRFFHKSFQEYVAGRRLSRLLISNRNEEVTRGYSYLQKINSVSDVISTYYSLLLYTCGSSSEASKKVINHLSTIHHQGKLFVLPSSPDQLSEAEPMKNEGNAREEGLSATLGNSFVECAISFLYESFSETTEREEFEEFFHGKTLYINTQSIPTYICGFFEYFSNCVSMLEFIKLDFWGSSSWGEAKEETGTKMPLWKTVIPEKAVSLFFNWERKLNSLEITLKDFKKLEKGDVKYLEKICCSASRLRLHISTSPGLTGKLKEVLSSCTNLHDLTVDSTPLTTEDEQQITKMIALKTIKLKDLQNGSLEGLLDGMPTLVDTEKLTFDNIRMNEAAAKKLAEGLKKLKKLQLLWLNNLTDIRDGITHIVKSISFCLRDLKEIRLVNCCLSRTAVEILVQNICNLPKLHSLDLSDNFLGDAGREPLCRLVDSLNILPKMKVLMLPWTDEVYTFLVKLEQLTRMPQLTALGLKKWAITDSDAAILGKLFAKPSLRDLQHLDIAENCMTSDGWLAFLQELLTLKKLTFLDFSREQGFLPSALLVLEMARTITQLVSLQDINLTGWQFDAHELREINKAKQKHRNALQVIISEAGPSTATTTLNPRLPEGAF